MSRTPTKHSSRRGLTTRPAAEYAGVSSRWLELDRARIANGQRGYGPPFRRVGTEYRYDPSAIDEWRLRQTVDPAATG